jgi:uncharacterized protein YgiM (DUF1202 family)
MSRFANAAANRQAQQAHARENRHFRQHQSQVANQLDFQARQLALADLAQKRDGTRRPSTFASDEDADARRSSIARTGLGKGFLIACALGFAAIGTVLIVSQGSRFNDDNHVDVRDGVRGSVRPNATWNLRAGPSTSSQVVGQLRPGEQVIVTCVQGKWAKLTAPKAGTFVYASGLSLERVPSKC